MFYAKAVTLAIFAKRLGYKTKHNPFVKATANPIPDMDDYVSQCQRCDYDDPENPIFPVGQIEHPSWVYEDIDY